MLLVDKAGNDIPTNSLIRWNVWDNDLGNNWSFIGLVKKACVVYLGGGNDQGNAIGYKMNFDDVIEQSETNDGDMAGITVVGNWFELREVLSTNFPQR